MLLLIFLSFGCGNASYNPQNIERQHQTSLKQVDIHSRINALSSPADKIEIPPTLTGGTFRFNVLETPNSLDPAWIRDTASAEVAAPLHEGLVEFDPITLEVIPCIAESWEISPDGLQYTFHLRHGVLFHDDPCFPNGQGREVLSTDFKDSFERVCDPRVASPGAWMFLGFVRGAQEYRDGISARNELGRRSQGGQPEGGNPDRFRSAADDQIRQWATAREEVTGLSCPDSRTFVVQLVRPFSPFLYRLGHSFSWPVPREAVAKYGDDFFKHPVGTGAFRFVEWIPGQKIVLEKNPKYWGQDSQGNRLPYLDRIEISQIPNSNSEHFEFLGGHLDLHYPLPLDRWENIFTPELQLQPEYTQFQVQASDFMRIEYIGLLNTDPLFQNRKLRQALNYAINREEVAATLLRYRAIPNEGWVVPRSMPGYKAPEGPYPYNPEKALSLLAEAGFPEGKNLPPLTLQLNAMGQENVKLAEVIQGYFAVLGITVNLQVVDWRVHLDTVREGKVVFYRMGWLNDYPSPENSLMLLATSGIPPEGENYARYSNPEFDRLYEAALAAVQPEEQNQLFAEAEQVAVADAPWIFLYDRRDFRLLSSRVRNFPMNPLDRRAMKLVWLTP